MSSREDASEPGRAFDPGEDLERVFRAEFGRIVAALTHRFGDLDLAEDMAQEAILEAINRWPDEGVPPNPGAWLTTTARNRTVDHLRREATRAGRQKAAHELLLTVPQPDPADDAIRRAESPESELASSLTDERLRLFFLCCHPALAPETQTALILRLLGGLKVAEVAAAFLVPERTMAQRLTRAKRKIRGANIPFRIPADSDLPRRLTGVLSAIYLVFNEGYLPSEGSGPIRVDLCKDAIRLARVLQQLMPDEPEVTGLLALLLLTHARAAARFFGGELVTLGEQDRSRWDLTLIHEGQALVRECLRRGHPGHYQLMAAINAVHTDSPTAKDTDWPQILALYDQLVSIAPTPVVILNRAVAVAEVHGPSEALPIIDRVDLTGYHPFHATRADVLRRLGRADDARVEYAAAIRTAANPAEIALLIRRADELI